MKHPRFTRKGEGLVINADFVIGCDGFHGICRPTIPASARQGFTARRGRGHRAITMNFLTASLAQHCWKQ